MRPLSALPEGNWSRFWDDSESSGVCVTGSRIKCSSTKCKIIPLGMDIRFVFELICSRGKKVLMAVFITKWLGQQGPLPSPGIAIVIYLESIYIYIYIYSQGKWNLRKIPTTAPFKYQKSRRQKRYWKPEEKAGLKETAIHLFWLEIRRRKSEILNDLFTGALEAYNWFS